MGDDCNVASRRSEDSPSSSSPALGARMKNLEDSRVDVIQSVEEREFLHLSRQSGEPGEEMYKIMDKKHIVENDLSQNELTATEPMVFVHSSIEQSTISVFPYFDTKLRPDAPPFMPESLTRAGTSTCEIIEINNEALCLEPSLIPRATIDDTCFVNIELSKTLDDDAIISSSSPEMKKHFERNNRTRDFRESIDVPELKTIDVTSTPRRGKESMQDEIESTNVSSLLPASLTNEESIVVVATTETHPNETNIDDRVDPIIAEPRIIRGYWRIVRNACILSNRIQIVVFIASLVIGMILVIYVVV